MQRSTVDEVDAAAIRAGTGGWAAATASTLGSAGAAPPADYLAADRVLDERIVDEMLATEDDRDRLALLRCAIVEEITAEAAQVLTGRTDGP